MKKIIFIIILLVFSLFLYGKYIEVNDFKINEYTINTKDIPETFKELKIVHFSDILYKNNNKEKIKEITEKINQQDPDIIIFTGDLFYKDKKYNEKDIGYLKEILKKMDANLFKFAVIGDNDKKYLDEYKDILYESNFALLDNENKLVFYKDNTPINVIGLTDLDNIETLVKPEIETNYNLVITHKPDVTKELTNYDIDTIISGHSLGGLINIPFYGGLIKKEGAKTYVDNYYVINNTELFISNGIGNEKFEYRLFNTPSINIYRFDN